MAVLARLLDIPSRVAVGYTGGSPIGHDRWDVRTSDAHAWPELYFQGAGWLRFEPTPSGSDGQATAVQPAYTLPPQTVVPGGSQSVATPTPTASAPGIEQGDSGALAKLGHLSARGTGGGGSAGHSGPIGLFVVVLVIVLLIAPRLVRSLTRRRALVSAAGDGPRAQAAWLELLDDLTDYKVAWSASESPRALGSRLTRTLRFSPEAGGRAGPDRPGHRAGPVRQGPRGLGHAAGRHRPGPPGGGRELGPGRPLAGAADAALVAAAGARRPAARAGRVQLDGPGRTPDGSLVPPRPAPPARRGRLSQAGLEPRGASQATQGRKPETAKPGGPEPTGPAPDGGASAPRAVP